jgi:uncharacterized protein YciI
MLNPICSDFAQGMTPSEAKTMEDHFQYLKKLTEEKMVILAGPVLTKEFGIVVLEAEGEQSARKIMENDPAVKNRMMMAQLYHY